MFVYMDSIACAYGERVDEGNIWMTQEIAALVNDCIGPCIPIMKGGATLAKLYCQFGNMRFGLRASIITVQTSFVVT